VLDVWRPWAPDVTGRAIDAKHFLAEDRPEETASALLEFLAHDAGGTGPGRTRSETPA
jgi:haloacetate dehalogenase